MYSKICLGLIQLSHGNSFLMIVSLDVMHKLIFNIPSVIQISSVSSIQLSFNLGKPRLHVCPSGIYFKKSEMKSVCDNSRATSQETQSNTASVTVQMMDVKHNNLDSVMKS